MAYLIHYGTPRHSGRYPWGSGEDPQRSKSFGLRVSELKKQGMTEIDIAKGFDLATTTDLRAKIHMEKEAEWGAKSSMAIRLKEKGYSNVEIGKRIGVPEPTVRNLLDPLIQERHKVNRATVQMLKDQINEKGLLDVGVGVNLQLGVTKTKLDVSLAELEMNGYRITNIQTPQLGTTQKTTVRVLLGPDQMKAARSEYVIKNKEKWDAMSEEEHEKAVAYLYVAKHKTEIQNISGWSEDGGETYKKVQPPISIDSKRVMVRFDDDETLSGSSMDGVIQLRRGVPDLSIGNNHYAQVRIAVDDTHYMKGMAIYADDLPDGIDIRYNSNKNSSIGKLGAMKKMNKVVDLEDGGSMYIDKEGKQKINEFGAAIRQQTYTTKGGKEKQSAINIVGFQGKQDSGVEGGWQTWSKTLSSQFLSKQPPTLAKQQLTIAYDEQKELFDTYSKITQPAVKQRLLDSFADDCDSKAVHLKAAALPRQTSNVLIPITSLKDNECYSVNYKNGEKVILIRFPHAGTFEIPVLTVNNKNKEGISVLGNAVDAIGITPKTAEKLSGADFDGDTSITLPYTKQLKVDSTLKALENFNPKTAYPKYEGMKVITNSVKQQEMGKVSNLITDMTIKGADLDEISRAVKHSMVVIDAEKHELDWKRSYTDNGIAQLKAKYQGGTEARPRGASTLISRASSEQRVDKRKALTKEQATQLGINVVRKNSYSVDVETGKKVWAYTGEGYYKNGKLLPSKQQSTKMYEVDDANKLVSEKRTTIELVYADYANKMKALGDIARKESANTKMTPYSPSAKETYKEEVASLNAKLKIAQANAPLERQAILLGNSMVDAKKASNPNLDAAQLKKIKGQALAEARNRVGASKQRINITSREWEAIESGAISNSLLSQVLNNTKLEDVQTLATPKEQKVLSDSKIERAKIYQQQGRTLSEIADVLGVSTSTISKALKGGD